MSDTDKTVISNMALSHLGSSKNISNLDTDRSEEGKACRTFFDKAVDIVLRDFAHPFSTSIAALSLIQQTPNNEWNYEYQYPSNCMMFRKIQSGNRTDSRQTRVPHRVVKASTGGKAILTDEQNAIAEWTHRETDYTLWPMDAILALSYLLAWLISPRITAGDPFNLGQAARDNYFLMKSEAEGNALNENQPDEDPDSEFITARE